MDSLLPSGDRPDPADRDEHPLPLSAPGPAARDATSLATRLAVLEAFARDIQSGAHVADEHDLKKLFGHAIIVAFDLEQRGAGSGRAALSRFIRYFSVEQLVPALWSAAYAVMPNESDWPIWLLGIFQAQAKAHHVCVGQAQSRWIQCGTAWALEYYAVVDQRHCVHRQTFDPGDYWPRSGDTVCFIQRDTESAAPVRFWPVVRTRR